MPLIILALGIVFLFVLIVKFKLNGFLSLLLACFVIGYSEGLPVMKIITSVETGMGGTLGHLGMILGLGAIFGKLMADGGGAQVIAMTLIKKFGRKNVSWAVALTGFIIGITLFWEVSFVVLVPIIFTIVVAGGIPLLEAGIPMLAAISVAHCFLPPHPGPTAVAGIFGANVGLTMMYGIVIAIPTVIICGPLFYKLVKNNKVEIPKGLFVEKVFKDEELPGFGVSVFTALIPVMLIAISMIASFNIPKDTNVYTFFSFIGNTDIALFIAVFVSLYTFGLRRGKTIPELMKTAESSIKSIAMIFLIIGAGGAFKQVIIDSGIGNYVSTIMVGLPVSPYLLAWIITAVIRVAIGSSTVTLFTASGIVLPILQQTGANPELMVLAVSCGSIFFIPPADAAFWMVKEYFNLSLPQTFKIWVGMTSLIGLLGLAGVMALSLVV
ncbi:gluconate:H+ symporter [Clostridium beijerinckii]|uniref:gluconate:H+ symporter n=1 Tax=Clostridium beijerinckii TaxID=1520 RepID=UPI00080A209F|nr:gluconate:H+ symporter [Clostridium beijerinckii]OCB01075.1 hypothetical protein BGS1_00925 [Clostridium beijerinckii]